MRPFVYQICTADEVHPLGRGFLDGNASADLLLNVARTVSADPQWALMPTAALVVRPKPRPVLAALGRFDEAAAARLVKLRARLLEEPADLKYVDYAQAERDSEALAKQLLKRVGRDRLRSSRFAAVPRGGFIVLGMLAYALGLESWQLEESASPEHSLVVVDDCSLTGSRFGRFLQTCTSRDIVFAHLYSHPDLRSAITRQEARVTACISARDLHDHAPQRLGKAYAEWRAQWLDRLEPPRYWVGQPGAVCFAWSEPDRATWNPASLRTERAWRLASPDICLKNRHDSNDQQISVCVQPEGKGPIKPSDDVLFGTVGNQLWIGNTQTEKVLVLSAVAADMWHGLIQYGNETDAVEALSERYEVEADILRSDLYALLERLTAGDLLVRDETDA